LAGLTVARSAERKASGDRIASLERLHGRIEERDQRIAELEAELENALAVGLDAPPATYAEWDQMMRTRVATSVATATYRLKDQIAHLRTVVAEKERLLRGRGRNQPVAKGPIPVTAIKGIGPVIAGILASHGITSIDEIAALSDGDIDRLGASMPVYPDRIRGDNWVRQAQSLLA
jgi:predicted flap endonuclease-1-like 5' DNA nuclease